MNLNVQYYDHPEGQDAFGKVYVTNKYALAVALGVGTTDCLFISKPQGYFPTISRLLYFSAPAVGMATAFTMTTYTATRLRGKDDKLNYVLGAWAAGGVFGAWRKSSAMGVAACAAFSIIALVKKLSIEEGWNFFPENPRHRTGSIIGARHDWTLTPEGRKNWTTGKE